MELGLDLLTLSDFQREIHSATVCDPDGTAKISSHFTRGITKQSWYCYGPAKFEASGSDKIEFSSPGSYDFLMFSYLSDILPSVSVRDEFRGKIRICWPHNVGHNRILSALLRVDDQRLQGFDSIWLDDYQQHFISEKKESYMENIGSVPVLEEWKEDLPAYPLSVPQPYYYSDQPEQAFPLFKLSKDSKLIHEYVFRDKLEDLLRVEKLENGEWYPVSGIHKYLLVDGKPCETAMKLKRPDLIGEFGLFDAEERAYHQVEPIDDKDNYWEDSQTFFVHDIISIDPPNTVEVGKEITVELESFQPCQAFFWNAENAVNPLIKNYSNYTNDVDVYSGHNVCMPPTLTYKGQKRLYGLDQHHYSRMVPYRHFPNVPAEPGYNAQSFSMSHVNYYRQPDVGVTMTNLSAKLSVTIKNMVYGQVTGSKKAENIGSDIIDLTNHLKKSSEPADQYLFHVRMMVLKKVKFVLRPDGKGIFDIKISPN